MKILYDVISDHIDHIIEKKRNKIDNLENGSMIIEINWQLKNKIYSLHQEINHLQAVKYKLAEILNFISDLDN